MADVIVRFECYSAALPRSWGLRLCLVPMVGTHKPESPKRPSDVLQWWLGIPFRSFAACRSKLSIMLPSRPETLIGP
jgi:hypothetical protein